MPGETYTCRADYSVPDGEYQSLCVGWTRYVETSADVWEEEAHGTTCEASYLPDARCRRIVFLAAKYWDYSGEVTAGVYVEGEPARIGDPTIPYGHAEMESGWEFELAETNTVKTTGQQMHVKSIARYTYNDTTGAWTLAERTKGATVTATYSGAPTRYVLEWAENTGFFIYLH